MNVTTDQTPPRVPPTQSTLYATDGGVRRG
jgi:hypothetical protein